MMIGLLMTARPFVLTILGPKWEPMTPVLRILAVASLAEVLYPLTGNLFLSQGRADLQFKVGLFTRFATTIGIVAGLPWGIKGVAAGFTLASILSLIPAYRFSARLVNLPIRQIVGELLPIGACTAGMAAAVTAVSWWIPELWPAWTRLVIDVGVGVSTYSLLIQLFRPRAYTDSLLLLDEWLRGQWQLRVPVETETLE